MEENYDFSQGKRGPVVPPDPKKIRITIRLDGDIVNYFKQKVHEAGGGNYQTLINAALRELVDGKRRRVGQLRPVEPRTLVGHLQ